MQLVYLAPVAWCSFAQRPHKFVEWFHDRTGGDILWIDPYPTRFPQLGDLRRLRSSGGGVRAMAARPGWLQLVSPFALPIEPFPGSRVINRLVWGRALRTIRAFAQRGSTWVGIGKPSELALSVLEMLPECPSVYDAMDDFPTFYTGISRGAMERREFHVAARVKSMLVSSSSLAERWGRVRPDVRVVRNGLDVAFVPKWVERDQVSRQVTFGYVGTIAPWFDWAWVRSLAESRPADVVRLIGPVFTQIPSYLPKNVELLPPCDHRSALLAMHEFDVGLIPFKRNELTDSVDPIKYYEYRALGLSVMSTTFGEMRYRSGEGGVFLVDRECDISDAAEMAVRYRSCREDVCRFIDANDWKARFDAAGIFQE